MLILIKNAKEFLTVRLLLTLFNPSLPLSSKLFIREDRI